MDVRYPVKGLYVWYPFGYSIRRSVYNLLRSLLDMDHEETLFPLLIPENEFMKEAEHIKGFEDEVYWVTHGGKTELEIPLALRPTSETAIYPMYALWVRSHADLPLKLYQIVNTFRYETKHTRPLIRLREITSFKEAHTVHATWDDAAEQVECAIILYKKFYEDLGIPLIISRRPDWDKFPGADYTIAVDTIMPDGKTLQIGTVHHLGDHFSKTFNIQFEDEKGEQKYAYQTCYGISERSIAAIISVHGDDKGLVLPPVCAPVQVVIVPVLIGKDRDAVLEASKKVFEELKSAGIRVKYDDREIRPGAKYYYWEMRGIPIRVELGPKDLAAGRVTIVNRLGLRGVIPLVDLVPGLSIALDNLSEQLKVRASEKFKSDIKYAKNYDEVCSFVETGVVAVDWCQNKDCADIIEEKTGASVLGTDVRTPDISGSTGVCIACGARAKIAILARSY